MSDWISQIKIEHACWDGYRERLGRLPPGPFPTAAALGALLPPGAVNRNGRPLRFRAASDLPAVSYEQHIFETGEIPTREENWHDLFNALVWSRLPELKAAMNAQHHEQLARGGKGRRGTLRDALTLLDESGAIVSSSDSGLLDALERRDWQAAFVGRREAWATEVSILVCGHAILEKFLHPYKSMTAHALFLHSARPLPAADLDLALADALLGGELLRSTTDLSPLPLMGIPGWWGDGAQDAAFYADTGVFRPPSRPA